LASHKHGLSGPKCPDRSWEPSETWKVISLSHPRKLVVFPTREYLVQDQMKVDLTNCDREPIHQLGTIQPIGFLVAVTTDWLITRVSANVADFIGSDPDHMVGNPLAEFFLPKAVHDLRNRIARLRAADSVERLFSCELIKDSHFSVMVHLFWTRNCYRGRTG
jgi:PAS fold